MAIGDLVVPSIVGAAFLLILMRPRGVNEGISALAAAALLIALGTLPLSVAADVAAGLVGVAVFLFGLFWLALAAERAGLIDRTGDVILRRAGGDGRRLLAAVFVFATLVTLLLSNDGTVVLVTPVVIGLCARLGIAPLPYVFAVTFVADSASSLVPVANPVNILFAEQLDIAFERHVLYLALPTFVALLVTYLMLSAVMRQQLPREIAAPTFDEVRALPMDGAARLVALGLGLTVLGYLASALIGFEPYWVTLAGGALAIAPVLHAGRIAAGDLLRVQPPGLYAFVLGLALIVAAVEREGYLERGGDLVAWFQSQPQLAGVLGVGLISALGTNLINNWTMALVLIPPLEAGDAPESLIFAGLFGADIGPNLTIVGSLATLIWMTQVRRAGLAVSGWTYLRLGALTTIPALVAAMVLLAAVSALLS